MGGSKGSSSPSDKPDSWVTPIWSLGFTLEILISRGGAHAVVTHPTRHGSCQRSVVRQLVPTSSAWRLRAWTSVSEQVGIYSSGPPTAPHNPHEVMFLNWLRGLSLRLPSPGIIFSQRPILCLPGASPPFCLPGFFSLGSCSCKCSSTPCSLNPASFWKSPQRPPSQHYT